jgi:hypothetical protein
MSTDDVEVDPETNLPLLPDGYYWHVRIVWSEHDEVPRADLSLRKGGRFFYVTTDSASKSLGYIDPLDVEAGRTGRRERLYPLVGADPEMYYRYIQELSMEVLEGQKGRFERESYVAKYSVKKKSLDGNYPPKKLEK